MNIPATTRLRDVDPRGRVDATLYHLGEQVARHVGVGTAWENGLGQVVEAVIVESGVPSQQITPVDVARAVGLLPPRPRLRGRR
jgi:hypothetical protein